MSSATNGLVRPFDGSEALDVRRANGNRTFVIVRMEILECDDASMVGRAARLIGLMDVGGWQRKFRALSPTPEAEPDRGGIQEISWLIAARHIYRAMIDTGKANPEPHVESLVFERQGPTEPPRPDPRGRRR